MHDDRQPSRHSDDRALHPTMPGNTTTCGCGSSGPGPPRTTSRASWRLRISRCPPSGRSRRLLPARRQAEGGTYRLRAGEARGHIDRGAKGQRDHWSDARRCHQPAADLIVTHDLRTLRAISSGSTIAAKSGWLPGVRHASAGRTSAARALQLVQSEVAVRSVPASRRRGSAARATGSPPRRPTRSGSRDLVSGSSCFRSCSSSQSACSETLR